VESVRPVVRSVRVHDQSRMTCNVRTGRETVTSKPNEPLHLPHVCHEAVEIGIHIGLCGGSSGLVSPFSISEANMISLMKDGQAGREEISDTGIMSMGGEDAAGREEQGGQQEDDGWVMLQRMHEGVRWIITRWLCRVRAGSDVDRRIVRQVRITLRTGYAFDTCCLFQAQPFQPGVLSSGFHGFDVFLRG